MSLSPNKTDEFSVKQDLEKLLRRVQLKAFFHDKSYSNRSSDKDVFQTLNNPKSKWTLPDGQFATVDLFLQKFRHDVSKLKFNRDSGSLNFKPDEWSALLNLRKRKDITISKRRTVVTKTRNHPKRPKTTHNHPQRSTTNPKRSTTTHNDPQRPTTNPKRSTTTHKTCDFFAESQFFYYNRLKQLRLITRCLKSILLFMFNLRLPELLHVFLSVTKRFA